MRVSGIPINPSVLSSGTKNLHLLSQVKRKIHRLKPGLECGGRYFSKPRTKPLIHNCCKFIHHQIKSNILFNNQSPKNVNNKTNREAPGLVVIVLDSRLEPWSLDVCSKTSPKTYTILPNFFSFFGHT